MFEPMGRTFGNDALNNAPPGAGGHVEQPLPEIDLRQFLKMTDDTGMLQHALYSVPDPEHGYCIDDNARALLAALLHAGLFGYDEQVVPLHRYLMFMAYAYNEKTGVFRNFMSYDRQWLEDVGSPDSQGRAIWALGTAVATAPDSDTRDLADELIRKALPGVSGLIDLRSKAFTLLGLNEYLKVKPDHTEAPSLRDRYADDLFSAFQSNAQEDWPWCEAVATYDNAKLCHALILSGRSMGRDDMVEQGLTSLRWLLDVQRDEAGHLSIIGNDGWLPRGSEKAGFDQQPLEAYALVHACLAAAGATGGTADSVWADEAWNCFQWFTGRNDLGVPLFAPDTGGCMDGLQPNGANRNQGAESTLAYLLSVLELHRFKTPQAKPAG
jgi:hypothetical protein